MWKQALPSALKTQKPRCYIASMSVNGRNVRAACQRVGNVVHLSASVKLPNSVDAADTFAEALARIQKALDKQSAPR